MDRINIELVFHKRYTRDTTTLTLCADGHVVDSLSGPSTKADDIKKKLLSTLLYKSLNLKIPNHWPLRRLRDLLDCFDIRLIEVRMDPKTEVYRLTSKGMEIE